MSNIELLGIGLTIFFGAIGLWLGVRAAKKRSQRQTVIGSGTAIQSGRDTKIES